MSEIKIQRTEGLAREEARRVIARRNLKRKADLEHERAQLLEGVVQTDMARIDRTIGSSVIWLLLLMLVFIALAWFGNDILHWVLGFGSTPAAKP
jgi:hypothetical protein